MNLTDLHALFAAVIPALEVIESNFDRFHKGAPRPGLFTFLSVLGSGGRGLSGPDIKTAVAETLALVRTASKEDRYRVALVGSQNAGKTKLLSAMFPALAPGIVDFRKEPNPWQSTEGWLPSTNADTTNCLTVLEYDGEPSRKETVEVVSLTDAELESFDYRRDTEIDLHPFTSRVVSIANISAEERRAFAYTMLTKVRREEAGGLRGGRLTAKRFLELLPDARSEVNYVGVVKEVRFRVNADWLKDFGLDAATIGTMQQCSFVDSPGIFKQFSGAQEFRPIRGWLSKRNPHLFQLAYPTYDLVLLLNQEDPRPTKILWGKLNEPDHEFDEGEPVHLPDATVSFDDFTKKLYLVRTAVDNMITNSDPADLSALLSYFSQDMSDDEEAKLKRNNVGVSLFAAPSFVAALGAAQRARFADHFGDVERAEREWHCDALDLTADLAAVFSDDQWEGTRRLMTRIAAAVMDSGAALRFQRLFVETKCVDALDTLWSALQLVSGAAATSQRKRVVSLAESVSVMRDHWHKVQEGPEQADAFWTENRQRLSGTRSLDPRDVVVVAALTKACEEARLHLTTIKAKIGG